MHALLLLLVSFAVGLSLRRVLPENASRSLNAFILYVSLPALTLIVLHDLRLESALWMAALMPWLLFGIAYVVIVVLSRRFSWSDATIGCLLLTTGLGNTSFVGLPMIEAFYGRDALGIGLIADQAGSFMALSTFGIVAAARYGADGVSLPAILKRMVLFPAFPCAIVALSLQSVEYPAALRSTLERLGQTLTPIALVSVGLQLNFSGVRDNVSALVAGLTYKLVLGPAVVCGIFYFVQTDPLIYRVTIFEAAMPPMITGGIIAMDHDLEPALAARIVGLGIPISFLTLTAWWWVMGR